MPTLPRVLCTLLVASLGLGASAHTVAAQEASQPRAQNVISANPLGLLFDFFNAEYERSVSITSTVGVGGSTFSDENDFGATQRYTNFDVFYRYYPSGLTFEGWNFGAKVGVTSLSDGGSYLGYGFDINRSWLLGPNKLFYVGAGFGLKRLIGAGDGELAIIPTFRLINIGRAF